MSNSKKSNDFDQLEEDSTLNRLEDMDDGSLGLDDDSDEIDLDAMDPASELESGNPDDFLAELEMEDDQYADQTDLNDILHDLESSSELGDDSFDDELVELTKDDMVDDTLPSGDDDQELEAVKEDASADAPSRDDSQQAFSFDDEDELAEEDDTFTEAGSPETDMLQEMEAEDDEESPFDDEIPLDGSGDEPGDDELDSLMSEMGEEDFGAEMLGDEDARAELDELNASDEDKAIDDAGFQPMDDFDDEGEALDSLSEEMSEQAPAMEATGEGELLANESTEEADEMVRELDDDELVDALDQASYAEDEFGADEEIPDSSLVDAVVNDAEEPSDEEITGIGEQMYAAEDDSTVDYDSDYIPDNEEELQSIEQELSADEASGGMMAGTEPPEADEAELPNSVGVDDSVTEEELYMADDAAVQEMDEVAIDTQDDGLYSMDDQGTQEASMDPDDRDGMTDDDYGIAPMDDDSRSASRMHDSGGGMPPPQQPAESGGGRSSLGLAILGVIVALGGAGGFWYSTKLGNDVSMLQGDVQELKEKVSSSPNGGVSRRDMEQLRDNMFAMEKRVEKPINDLRSTVDRQFSQTDDRLGRLETQADHMDRQLTSIANSRPAPGVASDGTAIALPDLEPRFSALESRIDTIQQEVSKLHDAILASSDPQETANLKQELIALTEEVVELRGKLLKVENMRAAAPAAVASTTPTPVPTRSTQPQPAPSKPSTATPAANETLSSSADTTPSTSTKAAPAATPAGGEASASEPAVAETQEVPTPSRGETMDAPGEWGINLRSYATHALAEKGRQQLLEEDIETVIREADVSGKTWYRLRLEGFGSSAEAKRFINNRLAENGFSGAWISRNQ